MRRSKRELMWIIDVDANPDDLSPEELDQMKREMAPYLLKRFKRIEWFERIMGDFMWRLDTLRILSKIKDDERVIEFFKHLKDPKSDYPFGLRALSEFPNHPQAKEVFTHYLHSDDVTDRECAALGLYRLGDPRGIEYLLYEIESVHPVLKKELPTHQRESATFTLGKLGDRRAIDPLFRNLGELDWYAAWALIDIAQKSEEETKEYIINKAAKALESAPDPSSPEALSAAYILCMLDDERGMPTMVEGLSRGKGKPWALDALARLNTDEALKELAKYLVESDVTSCIETSFTYRYFETDPLLKAIGVDMERLREERMEDDRLELSDIAGKISKKTLILEAKKREKRLNQMVIEALQNFRLKYGEKGELGDVVEFVN